MQKTHELSWVFCIILTNTHKIAKTQYIVVDIKNFYKMLEKRVDKVKAIWYINKAH